MAEHTKGPWKAELANAEAVDGAPKFWMVTAGTQRDAVAQMPWIALGIRPDDEANARLIAAAPNFEQGAFAFVEYEAAIEAGNEAAAMVHDYPVITHKH